MELKTLTTIKELYEHLLMTTIGMLTITGVLFLVYLFITEGGI